MLLIAKNKEMDVDTRELPYVLLPAFVLHIQSLDLVMTKN